MRPIIISTGLASNKEIKEAINNIRNGTIKLSFYIVCHLIQQNWKKLILIELRIRKITKIKNIGFQIIQKV